MQQVEFDVWTDERGSFFEWFKLPDFEVRQANCSISKRGVLRGIHFAKNPPGQKKYVMCTRGSVMDVVVDLDEESSTFGKWESIILDSKYPTALLIPNEIGHSFLALEDDTQVVYLCDQPYNPKNEFGINPLDSTIDITWPKDIEFIISAKDASAPSFENLFR